MPTFNSIQELQAYLNKEMADVLKNEVAQTVKNIEQEKVITEVYDKYNITENGLQEPYKYQRRGWNGGLADQKNMTENVNETAGGVTLTVENITKGQQSGEEIAGLIEFGDGNGYGEYDYKLNRDGTSWQYLRARPFTKTTEEELASTGEHIQVFKNGMKSKGIDIS